MGKYFEKFKYDDYHEYLKRIFDELWHYGYFKGSIETLEKLWRIFSEYYYCASFLIPDGDSIREFADWLDNYEEDI